jgi:hypothetical protein
MRGQGRKKGMMAALAAGGAALAVLWTPVGLMEMMVASTGLSEALPAAAPPLGLTARLMMAGFAALMAAGLVSVAGRDAGKEIDVDEIWGGRDNAAKGENKMGFALSKLAAFARGRVDGKPTLRRADAHPDAPARAPIFASRDFDGLDIFNRAASRAKAQGEAAPFSAAASIAAPAPSMSAVRKPWEQPEEAGPRFAPPAFLSPDLTPPEPVAMSAAFNHVSVKAGDPSAFADVATEPAPEPAIELPTIEPLVPTEGLTITQLTARLERGLAQRAGALPLRSPRVIADMPVAASVPVREAVEPQADEALAAALGTLRTMATRSR